MSSSVLGGSASASSVTSVGPNPSGSHSHPAMTNTNRSSSNNKFNIIDQTYGQNGISASFGNRPPALTGSTMSTFGSSGSEQNTSLHVTPPQTPPEPPYHLPSPSAGGNSQHKQNRHQQQVQSSSFGFGGRGGSHELHQRQRHDGQDDSQKMTSASSTGSYSGGSSVPRSIPIHSVADFPGSGSGGSSPLIFDASPLPIPTSLGSNASDVGIAGGFVGGSDNLNSTLGSGSACGGVGGGGMPSPSLSATPTLSYPSPSLSAGSEQSGPFLQLTSSGRINDCDGTKRAPPPPPTLSVNAANSTKGSIPAAGCSEDEGRSSNEDSRNGPYQSGGSTSANTSFIAPRPFPSTSRNDPTRPGAYNGHEDGLRGLEALRGGSQSLSDSGSQGRDRNRHSCDNNESAGVVWIDNDDRDSIVNNSGGGGGGGGNLLSSSPSLSVGSAPLPQSTSHRTAHRRSFSIGEEQLHQREQDNGATGADYSIIVSGSSSQRPLSTSSAPLSDRSGTGRPPLAISKNCFPDLNPTASNSSADAPTPSPRGGSSGFYRNTMGAEEIDALYGGNQYHNSSHYQHDSNSVDEYDPCPSPPSRFGSNGVGPRRDRASSDSNLSGAVGRQRHHPSQSLSQQLPQQQHRMHDTSKGQLYGVDSGYITEDRPIHGGDIYMSYRRPQQSVQQQQYSQQLSGPIRSYSHGNVAAYSLQPRSGYEVHGHQPCLSPGENPSGRQRFATSDGIVHMHGHQQSSEETDYDYGRYDTGSHHGGMSRSASLGASVLRTGGDGNIHDIMPSPSLPSLPYHREQSVHGGGRFSGAYGHRGQHEDNNYHSSARGGYHGNVVHSVSGGHTSHEAPVQRQRSYGENSSYGGGYTRRQQRDRPRSGGEMYMPSVYHGDHPEPIVLPQYGVATMPKPPTALSSGPTPKIVYIIKFKRTDRCFILGPRAPRDIQNGMYVKVEADRGEDLGMVVSQLPSEEFNANCRKNSCLPTAGASCGDGARSGMGARCAAELKRITRAATPEEVALLVPKGEEESELLKICREKVQQRCLPMRVIDAEYQFDRHKLTFFFEAECRIDFRDLVRDLFSIYKTRIWMQQLDQSAPIEGDDGPTMSSDIGLGFEGMKLEE